MGCTNSQPKREGAQQGPAEVYKAPAVERTPDVAPAAAEHEPSLHPSPKQQQDAQDAQEVPDRHDATQSLGQSGLQPEQHAAPTTTDEAPMRQLRARRARRAQGPVPKLNGVVLENVGPTVSVGAAEPHFDNRLWAIVFEEGEKITTDAGESSATTEVAPRKTTYYYNDTLDCEATITLTVDCTFEVDAPAGVQVAIKDEQRVCSLCIGPGETQPHVAVLGGYGRMSTNMSIKGVGPEYLARLRDQARAYVEAQVVALEDAEAAEGRPWAVSLSAAKRKSIVHRLDENGEPLPPASTVEERAIVDRADLAAAEFAVRHGLQFVDRTFAPKGSSMGPFPEGRQEQLLAWRRPADFLPPSLRHRQCAIEDADPGDINQGRLGDCYFCCAMSAVAEFPEIVAARFPQHGALQACGAHRVRLCDGGWWRDVIVDDFMPTAGRLPAFARNETQPYEQWVSLLEKAWAKTHGSYRAIVGGDPLDAMTALTGAATVHQSRRWGVAREDNAERERLFADMQRWDEAGALMSVATASVPKESAGGKALLDAGLCPNHAFTLIAVVAADGFQLLQIRNPWGSEKEWAGDFGDHSPLWARHPKVARACNFTGPAADGTFWMPLSDALQRFETFGVCHRRAGWSDRRVHVPAMAESAAPAVVVEMRVGAAAAKGAAAAMVCLQQSAPRFADAKDGQPKMSGLLLSHFVVEDGVARRVATAAADIDDPLTTSVTRFVARNIGLRPEMTPGSTHLFVARADGPAPATLSIQASQSAVYTADNGAAAAGQVPFTVRFIQPPQGLAPNSSKKKVDLSQAVEAELLWQTLRADRADEPITVGSGARFSA